MEIMQVADINKMLDILNEFYSHNYDMIENISKECLALSENLVSHLYFKPTVFITMRRTTQLEYEDGDRYLEIEVFDNKYEVFMKNGEEEKELSFSRYELYNVINIIKIWHLGKPANSVLFTGAFNPPHLGHSYMIQTVAGNKNFDYVIIALSNQEFVDKKQNKATGDASKITFSEQQRLEMMFEMTYRIPNVLIFGIEHGYTYEILHQIKEEYDIDNLYFAMGSDKLNEVARWGYHDKLLKEFCFYVMKRGNDTDEETNEKCRILSQYIIGNDDERYKDISSTLVREKIYNAQDYSELVNNNVKNYIDICSKNQPKKNGG